MHSKEARSVVNLLRQHPRAVLIVPAFTMTELEQNAR
jgi:hypothetical protein